MHLSAARSPISDLAFGKYLVVRECEGPAAGDGDLGSPGLSPIGPAEVETPDGSRDPTGRWLRKGACGGV